MVKEHNALDGNYKDAVRFLFKNESKFRVKTASCSRVFEQCSGTATIRLEVVLIIILNPIFIFWLIFFIN